MSFTVNYSPLRKWTMRENIALGTGIAFAALIMFSYYKLSGHGDRIMLKQEIVAQNYLEEELAMDGFEVYAERYNMKLRGEDAIVRAYDSSDTFIIMVYNKNKIISYEIKDN